MWEAGEIAARLIELYRSAPDCTLKTMFNILMINLVTVHCQTDAFQFDPHAVENVSSAGKKLK